MNNKKREKALKKNYSVINPTKQATIAALVKSYKPDVVKLRFRPVQCDVAVTATKPGGYVSYISSMLPRWAQLINYERYFFVREDNELKLFVTV